MQPPEEISRTEGKGPLAVRMSPETFRSIMAELAMGTSMEDIARHHNLSDDEQALVMTDRQLWRFADRYQRVFRREILAKVRVATKEAASHLQKLIEEAADGKDKLKALDLILKYFCEMEKISLEGERLKIEQQKARNEKRRFDLARMKNATPAQVEELGGMDAGQVKSLLERGAKITGIDLSGVENIEEVLRGVRVSGSEKREGAGPLAQSADGSFAEDLANWEGSEGSPSD